MSSIITGLGSGFDINTWVSQLVAAKQSSSLAPLQTKLTKLQTKSSAVSSLKSKFSALQSALQTFTKTIYNSSSDMWGNTTITSSNDAFATAVSQGSVSAAQVELEIEQVATATTAKSTKSLGAVSKENIENTKFTNLANGQADSGTFTMFLDGKSFEIEITEDDTVKSVMDKISDISNGKIKADISDDGIFSIKAYKDGQENKEAELLIGASSDTSNLVSALRLYEKEGTSSYKSSYAVSTANTDKAMASEESGFEGLEFYNEADENGKKSAKITINGVDFTFDENTSLNSLISKINGNSDANVKATYDSLTNKLILTSTETGQNNISLSEEGTNLLNVLGLTTGTGEDEIIAKGSQNLGQNAIVYINGNKVISTSNTITGESSGISNLSITVKKPTSEYSKNPDDAKSVTLDIEPDYTKVKEAIQGFVDAYNDVVDTAKTMTGAEGDIGHDSSLSSILTAIRSVTSKVAENDGAYKMLAEIGINASKSDISKLSIESSKLDDALRENFDSVKNLLSDGYVAKEDTGIFDSLLSTVSSALDVERGYFANAQDSIDSQINNMDKRIERTNKRIASYEARITKQFNRMDSIIASLNSQLSTFQSYI